MRVGSKSAEWRLVIPGRAYSFRSPEAQAYRQRIAELASAVFPGRLEGLASVRIDYFHRGSRRMDMDNVAKCILDALTGIGYADDQQVVIQSAQAHDLRQVIRLMDAVDVIKPLREHAEYVLVRVRAG